MEKDDSRYLQSLVRMDIRKQERGLAKFARKDWQTEEEAESFRQEILRKIGFRRDVLARLKGEK